MSVNAGLNDLGNDTVVSTTDLFKPMVVIDSAKAMGIALSAIGELLPATAGRALFELVS